MGSDSDSETPTEPQIKAQKPKKVLSEAQLAILAKAREKARESKLRKSKEKDADKKLKEKEKELERKEREKKHAEIEARLKAMDERMDSDEPQVAEPRKAPRPAPPPTKKRVRIDEPVREEYEEDEAPPVDNRMAEMARKQQEEHEKAAYQAHIAQLRHELVYKKLISYL